MSKLWLAPLLVLTCVAALVAAAAAAARDRDHDRLPDRWERHYGLSTTARSGLKDRDQDGLTNRGEYRARTNPRRKDTDRDRLSDRVEVKRYHTNPRRKDTDRDRLSDRAEIKRYHTNPRKRDSDGDGFSDGVEVRLGTNPRDPSSHPGGSPQSPTPVGPNAPGGGVPPASANVGVPAGWAPARTHNGNLTVSQAGAVVENVLIVGGNLVVDAPNVTVRRVKFQGGRIDNTQGGCNNGLLVEDSTFEPAPGQQYDTDSEGATGTGGYTARRVLIWRRGEGFRVGGNNSGCGPVTIEDSFAKISIAPGCPGDPHSDGIQGYDGPPLTVRNVTIDFREAACGTAPFFVPDGQGNTTANIDGMLVMGGGYTFRDGVPGSVRGLKIVDRSWYYGAVSVRCSLLSVWDAQLVTIDANYGVTRTVGTQHCTG